MRPMKNTAIGFNRCWTIKHIYNGIILIEILKLKSRSTGQTLSIQDNNNSINFSNNVKIHYFNKQKTLKQETLMREVKSFIKHINLKLLWRYKDKTLNYKKNKQSKIFYQVLNRIHNLKLFRNHWQESVE